MKRLEDCWYSRNAVSVGLLPAAWLFRSVAAGRRRCLQTLNKFKRPLAVPVIVVGNITVGGTGKTPLVVWLARLLKANGYKPGIVSRGYGGKARKWPQTVSAKSDPRMVGDEPVLIARRTACPLVAAPNRVHAMQELLRNHDCDVVISDDGLQHYALRRHIEIAMIDGTRRFGNGYGLPAGPLREPLTRLDEVDFVVTNGRALDGELPMGLACGEARNLRDPAATMPVDGFRHQRVHAVAGIGNPERFYDTLRAHGIEVQEHRYPDHHEFSAEDLQFGDDLPILMTEKDAVKCLAFSADNQWYLPVSAVPDNALPRRLIPLLRKHEIGQKAA